ncbi:cytochrome P450 [Apiospora saccharicola]
MAAHNETAAIPAQGLLQSLSPWYPIVLLPLLTLLALQPWRTSKEPPSLRATIPYISNGYQFLADKAKFFKRLEKAFQKANIIKFNIGPKIVYMVSGANNIQNLFRSGHGISDDIMLRVAADSVWELDPEDKARLMGDKTGRSKVPNPGYEHVPAHERYWAATHEIYEKFLSNKEYYNASAKKYFEVFSARLEKFPLGEWTTRRHGAHGRADPVAEPGLRRALLDVRAVPGRVPGGPPRWLNPRPYRALDNFKAMTSRWVENAWEGFDWDGPDAEAAWDPHFGARVMREISRWWKGNFGLKGQAGFYASLILAQNSNTVPAAMWCIVHLIEDRDLYRAVQDEFATAIVVDPATGERTLDAPTLGAAPLLNALYTETLRYHVTFNVMREVSGDDTRMDGYDLRKGAWIQASTQIAHFEESVWGREGHPASEFWIGRFLEYDEGEKVPRFNGSMRPGSFFPYGGGAAMCPGRQFARLEILITVALLVSKFDIESLEWMFPDGRESDRRGKPDESVTGSGVLRPDRDMKVRWKRLW